LSAVARPVRRISHASEGGSAKAEEGEGE
jgi:hypothetical protein